MTSDKKRVSWIKPLAKVREERVINVDYRLSESQGKTEDCGNEPDVDRRGRLGCGDGCDNGCDNDGGSNDMLEERVRSLEVAFARVETALHPLAAKSDVVEVKADLATTESRLIKWIIGSAFAAAATMIAFLNYTKPAMVPVIATPSHIGYSAPQIMPLPEK